MQIPEPGMLRFPHQREALLRGNAAVLAGGGFGASWFWDGFAPVLFHSLCSISFFFFFFFMVSSLSGTALLLDPSYTGKFVVTNHSPLPQLLSNS